MDIGTIRNLLLAVDAVGDRATKVSKLIEAGTELARVVRANVEEAAATLGEADAARLRDRAAQLALDNRALSEQVDSLLS